MASYLRRNPIIALAVALDLFCWGAFARHPSTYAFVVAVGPMLVIALSAWNQQRREQRPPRRRRRSAAPK